MGIPAQTRSNTLASSRITLLVLVAAASLVTGSSSPRPTGSAWVDILLTWALGVFVAFTSQHARPASISAAALVTAGIAADPLLIVASGLVALPGVFVPHRSRWRHLVRGLSGLGILFVLLRAEYNNHLGVSALVGLVVIGFLTLRGLRVYRKRHRRVLYMATGSLALALLVAIAGLFFSARASQAHLRTGNREAREGLAALNIGDVQTARGHLERALTSMERASHQLDSWATQPSRLVPVVAQYRNTIVDVVENTTAALEAINTDLGLVDPELLRPVKGRFDVAAITDLQAPMTRIVGTLRDLESTVLQHQSPWFVDAARNYLDDLAIDIDKYANRGERTLAALKMAPALLGANEERTYFVAFVTPSEVRGSGGFMGNWAEFRVNDGHITMSRFGRTGELNSGGTGHRFVTGPPDWLASYGPYGFTTGEGGSTESTVWSLITMSPQFPSTAQVITELYPQSGGRTLDGVFAIDIDVLSALLEFTGPIAVEQRAEPLTSVNARKYLLFEQYTELDNPDRVDVIDTVAKTAVDRLLDGGLPSPATLGNRLSPLASEGRILAYAIRPDEQQFFDSLNLTGDIRTHKTTDSVIVAVNNGSANKIDYFLTGGVVYKLALNDGVIGRHRATLNIDLTNTAPTDGYPDIVLGNRVDLPRGYSRLIVSALTRLTATSVLVNGSPAPFFSRTEAGLQAVDLNVDLPPGGSVKVAIELDGPIDLSGGYSLTTRTPLTANVWSTTVDVRDQRGPLVTETRRQQGFVMWVQR